MMEAQGFACGRIPQLGHHRGRVGSVGEGVRPCS